MDVLFDMLLEFLFTLFAEGFLYLHSAFVPNKDITPKLKKRIKVICLFVSLFLFAGLFAGIIILVELGIRNFWGWLLISLNVLYLLSAVVLKIIAHAKKS